MVSTIRSSLLWRHHGWKEFITQWVGGGENSSTLSTFKAQLNEFGTEVLRHVSQPWFSNDKITQQMDGLGLWVQYWIGQREGEFQHQLWISWPCSKTHPWHSLWRHQWSQALSPAPSRCPLELGKSSGNGEDLGEEEAFWGGGGEGRGEGGTGDGEGGTSRAPPRWITWTLLEDPLHTV